AAVVVRGAGTEQGHGPGAGDDLVAADAEPSGAGQGLDQQPVGGAAAAVGGVVGTLVEPAGLDQVDGRREGLDPGPGHSKIVHDAGHDLHPSMEDRTRRQCYLTCDSAVVDGHVVDPAAPAVVREGVGHPDVDRTFAVAVTEIRDQVDRLVGLVGAVPDLLLLTQHGGPVLGVGADLDDVLVVDGQY